MDEPDSINKQPEQPLVITLAIDANAQHYFDALRIKYYPAYKNRVPAHITLLHRIQQPLELVCEHLQLYCKREAIGLSADSIIQHRSGNAVHIESSELKRFHATLQIGCKDWLLFRDRKPFHPHITLQQGVTGYKSLTAFRELTQVFRPFDFDAVGIRLWLYEKGRWISSTFLPFRP